MSDALIIEPGERGVVRVFRTDRPALALKDERGSVGALELALGGVGLRAAYVEVFALVDLAGMALSDFIAEAHGVALPEGHALDEARGTIVVIEAGATPGGATLHPDETLTFLGRFAAPQDLSAPLPLTSEAAKRQEVAGPDVPPKPGKSDARVGGMVAMAALGVLFLLVVLMIWIAG